MRSQLQRSQASLGQVEMELIEGRQVTAQELAKTRDELARLRERYERLIESHKKMQKLNNNLEDKLLKLVGTGCSQASVHFSFVMVMFVVQCFFKMVINNDLNI